MAQSTSDPMSGPASGAAATVNDLEDDVAQAGRLISSRWRPTALRTTPSKTEHLSDATYYYGLGATTLLTALVLFAVAPWTQRQMADVKTATAERAAADQHLAG